MKRLGKMLWLVIAIAVSACTDEGLDAEISGSSIDKLSHEMIVLGKKLENPYSVENVTKAVEALYPTKTGRTDVEETDIYVRFLPANDDQLEELDGMDVDLMDHPLDYEIIEDGDYYQDPTLGEDDITWQYAVVPKGFKFPGGIRYEILDHCFISDNAVTRSDDGIDWDAVERESFRLTGNDAMLVTPTKGGKVYPQGRITIVDEKQNGGKSFGVAGVKMVCNVFVKFCYAYTDRDGYYKMPKKFSAKVRYRLRFCNKKSFKIGFNKIIVSASTSTLGKGEPEGKDAVITSDSGRKLYTRCVVNNAAYDYITRCAEDDMNLRLPPKNLRLWIFYNMKASSAVMLKHGAVLDSDLISGFFGKWVPLIKIFMPDITIGVDDTKDYGTIYSTVCHELAHASHFAQVGKGYWDKYIAYIISSALSGDGTYGKGTGSGAGHCEVGEMWGYFMQALMYNDRYGGAMPSEGLSYWFKPQIFRYLHDRGLSRSQIYSALTVDVDSKSSLLAKLIELYPQQQEMIEQVFRRYSD